MYSIHFIHLLYKEGRFWGIKDKKNVDFISKIRFINLSNVNSVTRVRTHNVFSVMLVSTFSRTRYTKSIL